MSLCFAKFCLIEIERLEIECMPNSCIDILVFLFHCNCFLKFHSRTDFFCTYFVAFHFSKSGIWFFLHYYLGFGAFMKSRFLLKDLKLGS